LRRDNNGGWKRECTTEELAGIENINRNGVYPFCFNHEYAKILVLIPFAGNQFKTKYIFTFP
jgi:hypothetical protein